MALMDTVTGLACSYLSLFCVELPETTPADPGAVPPDFYKKIETPKPAPRAPKPARLVIPSEINFGTVVVGSGAGSRRFTISNAGELELDIRAIEVSGSADFGVVGSCGVIRGGGVCTLEAQFSPRHAGPWNGSIIIGTPGDIARINLNGTGEMPVVKATPKPAPKPVKKIVPVKAKPKPKPIPRVVVDPRIEETIRSLDASIAAGPVVFEQASLSGVKSLPPLDERYHLEDLNYEGAEEKGGQDKSISSFPVERCRIIPTSARIPLMLSEPINSQICGSVTAHVAVDIYGPDGRIKLISKGASVEGSCEPLDDPDASRIPVRFSKLTLNNGAVIKLNDSEGSDAMGQAGLVGEKFDRVFDKYGPTAIASTIGAVIAYASASNTDEDGNTVDSPLSAAGESINQNIAQIVAEELRNASSRKRRIRVREGTLIHVKPTKLWYFPNSYQVIQMEQKNAKLTYTCNDDAFKDDSGLRQNPAH